MRIRRLDEQVALLKAVDEALRDSDYWRTTGFFSSVRGDNYYDHWLCLAIKEWAASHEPDGSQQWESALMAVAVESATRRGCGTGASATGFRRIGALATLRWLLPSLSFKPTYPAHLTLSLSWACSNALQQATACADASWSLLSRSLRRISRLAAHPRTSATHPPADWCPFAECTAGVNVTGCRID